MRRQKPVTYPDRTVVSLPPDTLSKVHLEAQRQRTSAAALMRMAIVRLVDGAPTEVGAQDAS